MFNFLINLTFSEAIKDMLDGFLKSSIIFFVTFIFAIPLGMLIYLISRSKIKIVRYIVKIIVWIVRGVPLMLQIVAFYYVPPILFKTRINHPVLTVCIAFIINYACYFSEIYRSGFDGISLGQTEAGLVLGLSKKSIFSKVILLQVIKRVIPPIGNETTTLIKDTALAQIISFSELMFVTYKLVNTNGVFYPLLISAIFYLIYVGIITLIFNKIEKKLSYLR